MCGMMVIVLVWCYMDKYSVAGTLVTINAATTKRRRDGVMDDSIEVVFMSEMLRYGSKNLNFLCVVKEYFKIV